MIINTNSNSYNQNKLNKSKTFDINNQIIKKNETKCEENNKINISIEQKQINNLKNDEKYKDIIKNDDNDIFKLTEKIAEKYGFEITNIIGKGGYSYVFEIKTIKASNIYACKIEIVKNQNSTSQEIKKTEEKNILKKIEKSLSKTLKKENIIKTLIKYKEEFKIDNVTYTINNIFM